MENTRLRVQVIRKLKYYLGAGQNSSIRYTPPFQVQIVPISLTTPDQAHCIRFCVVNTILPPINNKCHSSMFTNIAKSS